jgi:glyoxylase-like metal-dependent hydrolase (beta-lactamase superfamily II)
MQIIPFIYKDTDDLLSNTYIIVDSNKNCIVIDPSKADDSIYRYINKNKLFLKGVLLTHGHFDHMRGVDVLIDNFKCNLYVGFMEEDKLNDTYLNCSDFCNESLTVKSKAKVVCDGEILHVLENEILCISTPFHTNGSMSYYLPKEKCVFTGDFLFKGCVGRSDLPTAMPKEFTKSLDKIINLENQTKIFPGHGLFTTVGEEKTSNMFVK